MKYKLTITDTNIINIDILPGATFECQIYKGDGHYELSYGTIMKCNDKLVLMLCGLLFFGYSDHSWDSIHTYNNKRYLYYNYYQNDNDSMKFGFSDGVIENKWETLDVILLPKKIK